MTTPIPINLAFEDALTESLALKILRTIPTHYATQTIYNRGGYGYLKRTMDGFNNAAKGTPFLVGTDLDKYECPPALEIVPVLVESGGSRRTARYATRTC